MKFFAAVKRAARGHKIRRATWASDKWVEYVKGDLVVKYNDGGFHEYTIKEYNNSSSDSDWEVIKEPKPSTTPKELEHASIYSPPGTKLLYQPDNDEHIGYWGADNSKGELELGKEYIVSKIEYGSCWSTVRFVGLTKTYNLVNFKIPRKKRK